MSGESLKLAPIPWGTHDWEVFRTSLTQDDYWKLPPAERQRREAALRDLPESWKQQDSINGVSAYEAVQAPLSYWLMAVVLVVLKGSTLLAQVTVLRWMNVAIASLAVPLTSAIAWRIVPCRSFALGCATIVALMPEFGSNAARVSNEPLAIVLLQPIDLVGTWYSQRRG
ncbi:MAG: hypothetical protein WDO73_03995 [Ignavibacteriota bacterium]